MKALFLNFTALSFLFLFTGCKNEKINRERDSFARRNTPNSSTQINRGSNHKKEAKKMPQKTKKEKITLEEKVYEYDSLEIGFIPGSTDKIGVRIDEEIYPIINLNIFDIIPDLEERLKKNPSDLYEQDFQVFARKNQSTQKWEMLILEEIESLYFLIDKTKDDSMTGMLLSESNLPLTLTTLSDSVKISQDVKNAAIEINFHYPVVKMTNAKGGYYQSETDGITLALTEVSEVSAAGSPLTQVESLEGAKLQITTKTSLSNSKTYKWIKESNIKKLHLIYTMLTDSFLRNELDDKNPSFNENSQGLILPVDSSFHIFIDTIALKGTLEKVNERYYKLTNKGEFIGVTPLQQVNLLIDKEDQTGDIQQILQELAPEVGSRVLVSTQHLKTDGSPDSRPSTTVKMVNKTTELRALQKTHSFYNGKGDYGRSKYSRKKETVYSIQIRELQKWEDAQTDSADDE